jgi:hypothetical protein
VGAEGVWGEDVILLRIKKTSQDVAPLGTSWRRKNLEKRPAFLVFVGEEEAGDVIVGGIVGTEEDGEGLVWTLAWKRDGNRISREIKGIDTGGDETCCTALEILEETIKVRLRVQGVSPRRTAQEQKYLSNIYCAQLNNDIGSKLAKGCLAHPQCTFWSKREFAVEPPKNPSRSERKSIIHRPHD